MRRSRLALGLAVGGLAAALVGALGPAEEVRTTYTWPPPALPEAKPDRLWHTPLMLLSRRPEAISAAIPCRLPPALPRAPRPTTVLGTTRDPAATGGLAVTRASEQLAVAVGEHVLVRAPLRLGENGEQCTYRLRLAVNTWRLEGGQLEDARVGDLVAMPVVHGLFSGLDLAAGMPVSVDVTTTVHDVRPTAVQTLAWLLAAAAIAAALGLVAFGRTPRIPRPEVGRIVARAHPADAVVAVALVGWWILSPAFWDDGWIAARLESYSESGGFSSYYDILGSNNPLGFWLDWVHRLFMHVSDSLLVLRLPVLLSLAATWALCRYVLGRSLRGAPADVALWALASMLLLGAFAWGMNLRPEFALALLVTGTAACTLRFLERETAAPLALAGVLVPLAILAHPAGFVTLAPLLLASPRLLRWARSRLAAASAVVASSVAALVLLGFVGSDLEQRRQDVRTFEEYGTSTQTWRDESLRYVRMSEIPYATPVRRAWVALTALAVVAFLLRRRAENRLLDLPQAATGLGLVLLVATPSKWPSHFGALLGLAAVAVAVETARLRADAEGARRWDARPFVVAGLAMLAAAWSWSPRTPWAHLDLRVLDWILGFESRLSLSKLMFALPLVLLIGLAILTALRHGRAGLSAVPWKVATWTALVVSIPPLVFTVAVLTADNLKADGWTLARQNLGTLRGDADCGLAEELGVERLLEDESTRTYVVPDLLVYFPCVRQPRIGGGIAEAPDYAISRFEDSGLEAWEASPFHPVVQLYPLDQVPLTNGPPTEVFLYQVGGMPGAAKALPVSTEGGSR